VGVCGVSAAYRIARIAPHLWEEPPISGQKGSGTVFFSGCNLRCVFCQNREISREGAGKTVTEAELTDRILRLQDEGVHNINFVTPTHYTSRLAGLLESIKPRLRIPVVWNCGGYESVETIRQLDGLVDVYLPDMKYADDALAKQLSGADDYFTVASQAIKAMAEQVGPIRWQGEKVVKGVIIRHLILPGQVDNSLRVLDWIGENFKPGQVLVSLMRQYTPMPGLSAPLDRKITDQEYDAVLSWMYLNDLEGFTQEETASDTAYIPQW
jgi:putative pyruvate formate lyase activating enzyme